MDIFVLKALVDDLQQRLQGAVVSKVFQIGADDVLLRLWRRHDWRLLMSTHALLPRLHLTTERFQNPPQPPRFAAFLRAQLQRTRLHQITVQPYERLVRLTWEYQDAPPLTLIHELLGTQSNVILVDAHGRVREALKRVSPYAAHHRAILPGQPYQPPGMAPQRLRLSDLTYSHLETLHRQQALDVPHLQHLLIGVSAVMVTELVHRSQGAPRACWQLLCQLRQDYDNAALTLTVSTMPDGTRHVSALPLTYGAIAFETFDSAQDAVAAVYQPALQMTRANTLRLQLQTTVRQRQQKLRKKIANLEDDHNTLQTYLPYQRYGTLLLSQQVHRGAPSVSVVDYYSPDQPLMTIPLDPRLSLIDNAERYFKKYRKAKRGLEKVAALLTQCRAEEQYLAGVAEHIMQANDEPRLQALATQLHGGSQPTRQQSRPSTRAQSAPAAPYRLFTAHDGAKLYCGKNDRGNAALLRHIARPDDLWFHAHGHAGAHVLLQAQPHQHIPQHTLIDAASLAAYYSKGNQATAVEVIYTQAKHVHTFRGARPGQVRVTIYRTLEVAPRLPSSWTHTEVQPPPQPVRVRTHALHKDRLS